MKMIFWLKEKAGMHNIMIGRYAINFHSIRAMHTFPLPGAPIRDIIDAKFCCLATATDIAIGNGFDWWVGKAAAVMV